MPTLRRHDYSPRLEMMPLLDVVFLLLCFFIYSFVVMIRADALSVGLASVTGGGQPSGQAIQVLTIDADGGFNFAGQPMDDSALDTLLRDLAADPAAPTLYVSLAQDSTADRGPIVWDLLQRVEQAGLENFAIVGPPDAE
ncbi:ExbD/TolR family protein [Algisphaera agarilytica]|uniref:Biopolymer transport protein ExbD n=1 Tax=Algisphaera agarilytica TaxID=1385975 RepID=A0A7X0H7S6_9BACT|nr:biopolymer transporter ExbD [Algisphaera agarilytica]MBB6430627.1 biopolymer transport protein ExbD [Algisphaera agarilytica]